MVANLVDMLNTKRMTLTDLWSIGEVSRLGYTFKCKDLGLQCDYQATADSAVEVAKQASAHAMQAHKAEAMTIASKIKDAVKKT